LRQTQQGKLGVDLSQQLNDMKNQSQQSQRAQRVANSRNCIELNGVWIDDQYKKETPTLKIKTMSNAYFKILEKQPKMKEVFALSQNVVWITPNGTALVIDPNDGKDELTDEEIAKLYARSSVSSRLPFPPKATELNSVALGMRVIRFGRPNVRATLKQQVDAVSP
jgi:Ca-activated chloride channel family protein